MGNTQKKVKRRAERAARRDRVQERKNKERAVEDLELREWGVVNRKLPPPHDKSLPRDFLGWTEVTVTAADAAEGMKGNKVYCGLCLALQRHGFHDVLVTTATVRVSGWVLLLPDRIAQVVQAMDDGTAQLPFTFRLPVLNDGEFLLWSEDKMTSWTLNSRGTDPKWQRVVRLQPLTAAGAAGRSPMDILMETSLLAGGPTNYVEGRWSVPEGFVSGMDDDEMWDAAGSIASAMEDAAIKKLMPPGNVLVVKTTQTGTSG